MKKKYRYNAKVMRVVDGDTLDLEIDLGFNIKINERVRLFGIDTPETRTKDLDEKKRGLEAKEYVREQIEFKDIRIETEKDKGKFGRYLATIFYDVGEFDCNLNQVLVKTGLAKEYYGGKK